MLRENILKLKECLISEANIVQIMIEKSIQGLLDSNNENLIEVFRKEDIVNRMELEIDQLCTETIALYQPEAKDLRTVLMVFKINNDIERIGDQAVNIADSSKFLRERKELYYQKIISQMGKVVISMIRDSISAFANEDIGLSSKVWERDNVVDNYHKRIVNELIQKMYEEPEIIERALHLIRISKNLERIADLSTNIAEDTIFMSVGRVIKHNIESND